MRIFGVADFWFPTGHAKTIGTDLLVATDDLNAIANLAILDVVADAVNGKTVEKLIAKVKPGGVFASVLGAPRNAEKYTNVKTIPVYATADAKLFSSWPRPSEMANW